MEEQQSQDSTQQQGSAESGKRDYSRLLTPAAIASECIAEQAGDNGFWQFTDAIFAR